MINNTLSRRTLMASAAVAAAALTPFVEATAQTAKAGGDWFGMVKAHHLLIAKTLDEAVKADKRTYASRDTLLRTLSYQLTAHSVAEENVLYPALASINMVSESDMLYLDQAHAKVMNAQIEMTIAKDKTGNAWIEKVVALRTAVLKHAKEDEEANLFPKLLAAMDASQNTMLTTAYHREFASVSSMTRQQL
jgi:hypothetical protein